MVLDHALGEEDVELDSAGRGKGIDLLVGEHPRHPMVAMHAHCLVAGHDGDAPLGEPALHLIDLRLLRCLDLGRQGQDLRVA